jgi:hypothetical protein
MSYITDAVKKCVDGILKELEYVEHRSSASAELKEIRVTIVRGRSEKTATGEEVHIPPRVRTTATVVSHLCGEVEL